METWDDCHIPNNNPLLINQTRNVFIFCFALDWFLLPHLTSFRVISGRIISGMVVLLKQKSLVPRENMLTQTRYGQLWLLISQKPCQGFDPCTPINDISYKLGQWIGSHASIHHLIKQRPNVCIQVLNYYAVETMNIWTATTIRTITSRSAFTSHSLLLERLAGHEPSEGLVLLLTLPVCLPPVGVLLVNNVEDVPFHERQAKFPARDVGILLGVVVVLSPHVNLARDSERCDWLREAKTTLSGYVKQQMLWLATWSNECFDWLMKQRKLWVVISKR